MNLVLFFTLLDISVGGFIVARVNIRLSNRMSKMILDDKSKFLIEVISNTAQ